MGTLHTLAKKSEAFETLVNHYLELQKIMVSLEKSIFSCEVHSREEKTAKERIAKEIWDRDYVVYHFRNFEALAVLTKHIVEAHHNRNGHA